MQVKINYQADFDASQIIHTRGLTFNVVIRLGAGKLMNSVSISAVGKIFFLSPKGSNRLPAVTGFLFN